MLKSTASTPENKSEQRVLRTTDRDRLLREGAAFAAVVELDTEGWQHQAYWTQRVVGALTEYSEPHLTALFGALLTRAQSTVPADAATLPPWWRSRAAERDVLSEIWLPSPSLLLALPTYAPPIPLTDDEARELAIAKLTGRAATCQPPQSFDVFMAGLVKGHTSPRRGRPDLSTIAGYIEHEARERQRRHADDQQALQTYRNACYGLHPAEVRALKRDAALEGSQGFLVDRFRTTAAPGADALTAAMAEPVAELFAKPLLTVVSASPACATANDQTALNHASTADYSLTPPLFPMPPVRSRGGRPRNSDKLGTRSPADVLRVIGDLVSVCGSQRKAAQAIGVDRVLIARWLSCASIPTREQLKRARDVVSAKNRAKRAKRAA